jgi:hypothetical protein
MLTQYGPGKFSLMVDALAYSASMDGCGEEVGDVDTFGHYCLVTGGKFLDTLPDSGIGSDDLSEEDRAFVQAQDSAIVHTDSQGFVSVDWFTDEREARARWSTIESDYEQSEEALSDMETEQAEDY